MRKSLFQRVVSYFLSLILVFEPLAANKMLYQAIATALPWGMGALSLKLALSSENALAQYPGVTEGQNTGGYHLRGILEKLPTINSGRTTVTLPSAGGITKNQAGLIPTNGAQSGDTASAKSTLGDSPAFDGVVSGVVGRISSEPSTQGDVYRTMTDTKRRRANYANSSFLSVSKGKMEEAYTGCTTNTVVTPNPGKAVTLTEDKTCSRIVKTVEACHVERLFNISGPPVVGDVVSVSNSVMKTIFPYSDYHAGSFGGIYETTKNVTVDWSRVSSVALTNMVCDDDCVIWARNADGGSWFYIPITSTTGGPANTCTERNASISFAPPSIDITSYVAGMNNLQLRMRTCVMRDGGSNGEITWTTSGTGYTDRGFLQNPPGCWQEQYDNLFCSADSWTCTDSAPKSAGGVTIDIAAVKAGGGKAIWSDSTPYENTAFEATNVCWKADASGLCNFNNDDFPCFISQNGQEVCPTNDGEHADSCQPLEDDGCVFQGETCMEGGRDPHTGTCMIYTSKYKCDVGNTTISQGATTATSVSCSATRCMGTECANGSNESNTSFGMVSGLLGNLNSMGQDGECDASGCMLFKGKNLTCKKALGGLFDCCNKNIPGVNWMDYLKLAHGSYKLAQEYGLVGDFPSISGIGASAINGVVQTVGDMVGSEFMSAFDISSAASSLVPDSISILMDELVAQAYEWVVEAFGETVAANFFTVSGGSVSVGATAGSLMSTVMTVFIWVYVAYIVLSIIFACKGEEFELAANKQMRACHYVGTFCSGKALGWCYAKKESYCCYGSALSRIMQEQIRMQILGWGTAQSPNCGGLTPADMLLVNWDLVNLDEYAAMMTIAGIKPGPGKEDEFYKMENVTKINMGNSTHTTDRGNTSQGLNSVEALQKKTGSTSTTGLNADDIRMNAIDTETSGYPVSPP